jgi:cell fate regulator YaaT (PSP1 superfamily)
MLRDRRPRDGRKTRGDLDDRQLVRADQPQDLAPVRLRDSPQGEVGAQCYSRNGCGRPDSTNALSRPTTWPHV